MIFRYLFPKLSAYVNYNEAELDNMAKLVVTKKDASFLGKAKDFGGALLSILAQKLSLSDMANRIKIAREDIMHSRIQPNILNKHYKREDTLNNRINDPDPSRRFKMLMSSEDMNVLINTGVVPE